MAASLGISAVVLHGCGAGYFYDGWKAENWARLAHWGMAECLFDAGDFYSTSKRGDIYSYSEGPGYFEYGMLEAAMPFLISFRNMVTPHHDTWTFPYGKGDLGANHVTNYWYDKDIRNLFDWYQQIQLPNGLAPTYDNSDVVSTSARGIWDKEHNTGDSIFSLGPGNVDLRVDYLVALGSYGESGKLRKSTSHDLKNITRLDGAGNMILRMNQDSSENRQYLLMLYEHGIAHDAGDNGGTHEDDDVGSFLLAVDNDQLAIDPGYRGWENRAQTSKYLHHNVVLFDNSSSMIDYFATLTLSLPYVQIKDVKERPDLQSFKLRIEYIPYFPLSFSGPILTRNVNQIKLSDGRVYYLMNDYAQGNSYTGNIQWQLNGNGRITQGFSTNSSYKTFQQDTTGNNRIYRWMHPCSGYKLSGKWNLYANVGVLNGLTNKPSLSTITSETENGTLHSNVDWKYLNSLDTVAHDDQITNTYGQTHTRAMISQAASSTIFQSVLIPYKCNNESNLPIITRKEDANKILTVIRFPMPYDTSFQLNYIKTSPHIQIL